MLKDDTLERIFVMTEKSTVEQWFVNKRVHPIHQMWATCTLTTVRRLCMSVEKMVSGGSRAPETQGRL